MIGFIRWLLLMLFAGAAYFLAYALVTIGVDTAGAAIVGAVVGVGGWLLALRWVR